MVKSSIYSFIKNKILKCSATGWLFSLLFLFAIIFYFFLKKWHFKEGMIPGKPMSMNVTITNNYSGISDVNPNGYYTAYVKDDPYSVPMTLDQPTNIPFFISKNILDSSLVTLTVQPIAMQNQSKPHYGDVFPQSYQVDVTIDSSFVLLDYYSGALNYDNRITVDANGVLNANQVGTIMDANNNTCGYVKKDVYTPQHFFVTVTQPIDIKKIVFTWKLGDLSNVTIPSEFGPAEYGVIGNTIMHAPSSYIGNTYIGSNYAGYVSFNGQSSIVGNSYTGNSYVGNSYTGNSYVGNSYVGNSYVGNCSPGSLCSGNTQLTSIR
jgi:hypothetical protein